MVMIGNGKFHRIASIDTARAAHTAVFVLSTVLFTSTCELPPSFSKEYDDTNNNFIDGFDLAAPSVSADAAGQIDLDLPAVWDWAWRGNTENTFEYMTLTDAGAVGTSVTSGAFTLADTAASWRLELKNLAGDPYFEDTLPDGWGVKNGASTATVGLASTSISHGQYVLLNTRSNDWAGFNPYITGFILDDPASRPASVYNVSAYSGSSTVRYAIGDYMSQANFDDPRVVNLNGSQLLLESFSVDSENTRVMFAVANIDQSIDIDDLSISRKDLANEYCLRLRLRPDDTVPGLAPGRYEFSLWIKTPADSLPRGSVARASDPDAPFSAASVRLELRQVGFSEEGKTIKTFTTVFPTTGDWTRVALSMGDDNLDRFERTATDAVIELAIYPFGSLDNLEPGTVLIAAPSLRFFRNGYID